MIVYRVEDTEGDYKPFKNVGCGVYSGSGMSAYLATTSCDDSHPCPKGEGLLSDIFDDSYVCCFQSLEDLRKWFDPIESPRDFERVFSRVRIATYTVPNDDFHAGRWQAIAKAESMVLVETHNIYYREVQ